MSTIYIHKQNGKVEEKQENVVKSTFSKVCEIEGGVIISVYKSEKTDKRDFSKFEI